MYNPKTLSLVILCLLLSGIHAVAQTCKKGGFQAIIGDNGQQTAYDLKESIGGNGYIIAGSTTQNSTGGTDALLIATDTNGVTRWAKTYGSPGNDVFFSVILTKDGNYLAVGWCSFTGHAADIFVAKIDPNGNLLWSKSYGAGTSYGELGRHVTELDDGSFAIAADYNAYAPIVQSLYIRISATGTLIWSTMLEDGGSSEALGIVAQGDIITGTGVLSINGSNATTYNDGYIIKLHAADGSMAWTKRVESQGKSNRPESMLLRNGQYVFDMYNIDTWFTGNTIPLIFITDTSANILYSQSYEINGFAPNVAITRGICPTADGGFLSAISEYQANTAPRLVKIGPTGTIDWTDDFVTYASQEMFMALEDGNGNKLAVGQCNQPNGSTGILFIKTNSVGLLGDNTGQCQVTHPGAVNNNIPIQITDATTTLWTNISNGGVTDFTPTVVIANYVAPTTYPCNGLDLCKNLSITGKDTLCDWHSSAVYLGKRDPGCTTPIVWTVDNPAVATILPLNDSMVQVQFTAPGSVTLHGVITTTCAIITADKKIWSYDSIPVKLGNDTTICTTASLKLDAGTGFISYDWSTGESTQKITVQTAGEYWVAAAYNPSCFSRDTIKVEVIDYCRNLTITGRDTLCDWHTNTVYLGTRDPGCTTPVVWSVDNPAIVTLIALNDSMVQVQFNTPGSITLHGELTTACSIITADKKIWSYDSIPVKLGNDTGICIKTSLPLDAGAGFISYDWSTGESTQQITVQTAGEYRVTAAYNPSCFSRDTLKLTIYDPKVNIGPDTSLCRNDTYTFVPNTVFNSYLWQDGSTGDSYTTGQMGEYWLQVEDSHHCFARDTAGILTVHELPEGFLPATATICTDDYLVLKPEGTWSKYLWSTGAVTDTTTITAPGAYWLQVTDRYGCKGRDNIIIVAADCRRDIYFPGAFTPNGDGNNDVFRPKTYGTLSTFYMVIFNRWGEKVFETKDASHGWNGVFNGQLQPTGSFVWYATWLFSGRTQRQHQARGNLTLIR